MSIYLDSNLNPDNDVSPEVPQPVSLQSEQGVKGPNVPMTEELAEEVPLDVGDTFGALGVHERFMNGLRELGYTQPSPIQEKCIPVLLKGQDLLGMAETGSGKTAAFCLPGLQRLDATKSIPQMLVLTPTRELALQVSQACENYAKNLKNVHVATIYGGQSYELQRKSLRRGAQVVVATPGRLLDFIESKSINLSEISFVVLDEADEILRMGFVEAINEILQALPEERQTALFSATMPDVIKRITHRYMKNPTEVRIQSKQRAAQNIVQRYCLVNPAKKLKVLERFLETEPFESVIIFVKTKGATAEVASFLEHQGYRCAALNGDMTQTLREQTLAKLRSNKINILVATDVAARGLDIEHLGLVINYDFPGELESYVHRIGRTGRAGRTGVALLFVEGGQERGLRRLEKMLGRRIDQAEIPNSEQIKEKRFEKLMHELANQTCSEVHQNFYNTVIATLKERLGVDGDQLSAQLLMQMQRTRPLLVREDSELAARPARHSDTFSRPHGSRFRSERVGRVDRVNRSSFAEHSRSTGRSHRSEKMRTYRLEMGRQMGLHTKHLVGALINEGRLSSHAIGNIKLFPSHTHIEISEDISVEKIRGLARVKIFNMPVSLTVQG